MKRIDIDLRGLTKAEALAVAREAFWAEANVLCVRNRLQFLASGHSFETIGGIAEWQQEELEKQLPAMLTDVAAMFDRPKPALRLVSDAGPAALR